jgi:hypothetical protein
MGIGMLHLSMSPCTAMSYLFLEKQNISESMPPSCCRRWSLNAPPSLKLTPLPVLLAREKESASKWGAKIDDDTRCCSDMLRVGPHRTSAMPLTTRDSLPSRCSICQFNGFVLSKKLSLSASIRHLIYHLPTYPWTSFVVATLLAEALDCCASP